MKNKIERLTLPDFKTYYKARVIRTEWYRHKDRPTDQQNRTEGPETNPNIYGQTMFEKGAKTVHGKRIFLSTNDAGKTAYSHAKE